MGMIKKFLLSELYDMASGISSKKEQAGHGSPFVSFGTVFNNYFLPDELPDLMDTSEKEQEIYSIKENDVLVTRTSETIDELAMSCVALKDYPSATYSGFTKRLRPKTEGIVYSKYLAFYLRGYLFRKAVTNNAFMTLRASFNEDIFSFLNLYLPEYNDQVKIGDLLYSLEQKIQINNKINDNLEHQLIDLFRYLFLQKGTISTLPNGKLSDIAFITMGQSPTGDSYNEAQQGCVFFQGSTDFGIRFPFARVYTKHPKRMANTLDTLLSVRAPIGAINIAFEDCCIGRGLAAIKGKNHNNAFVRYFLRNSQQYFNNLNSNGTTFGSLTKDELFAMPIFIPNQSDLFHFENIAYYAENLMLHNEIETRRLTVLRDWLLPMLMNGQATIDD